MNHIKQRSTKTNSWAETADATMSATMGATMGRKTLQQQLTTTHKDAFLAPAGPLETGTDERTPF